MNNYTVYMHKNKINNKVYIGITKQNVHNRWGGQGQGYMKCPRFWNAIQKYGWDNFEHIILFEKISKQKACEKERELIAQYNSTNELYGYNMTEGGESHYTFTEEVKQKLREQKIGDKNPQWGVHKTDEQKEYQRQKMKEIGEQGGNHCKKVKCIETGIVYYSCKEAARNTGSGNIRQATHIADVCNKKRNSCNGYKWEWIEDAINN